MSDQIAKAIARRDFLAGKVLEDEEYLHLFLWAERRLETLMAGDDKLARARLIAQKRAA